MSLGLATRGYLQDESSAGYINAPPGPPMGMSAAPADYSPVAPAGFATLVNPPPLSPIGGAALNSDPKPVAPAGMAVSSNAPPAPPSGSAVNTTPDPAPRAPSGGRAEEE